MHPAQQVVAAARQAASPPLEELVESKGAIFAVEEQAR